MEASSLQHEHRESSGPAAELVLAEVNAGVSMRPAGPYMAVGDRIITRDERLRHSLEALSMMAMDEPLANQPALMEIAEAECEVLVHLRRLEEKIESENLHSVVRVVSRRTGVLRGPSAHRRQTTP